jgi:hypothetical protein
MRKLVPLLEAAAKSQLPDVKVSCCTWGGGVLEFPPQPAIKRAKDATTTTQTGRNDFSSVGKKPLNAISNDSVTRRELARNKKTGYGSNTRKDAGTPTSPRSKNKEKAPRFRSAFEFQIVFLRVSAPPWWMLRFSDSIHKSLQLP